MGGNLHLINVRCGALTDVTHMKGYEAYKGDGICDDENNHCGCDYDGGDCCGPDVECGESPAYPSNRITWT